MVLAQVGEQRIKPADEIYLRLLEASERAGSRSKYVDELKDLKRNLVQLRSMALTSTPASEAIPDFSRLVSNPTMQAILAGRWVECANCLRGSAPLAATVMMGGLLEGLLLARVHQEPNQAAIFTAKSAPKNKDGSTKRLNEWVLFDLISVAHELEWITVSAKSVGHVLRDYRNYIHPQKQFTENVTLGPDDAALWWEMVKAISRELL